MEIPDAVVVYVAATNLEAHVIEELLQANDIPALAVEDHSLVGMWIGGTLPMIHRPKIWVASKHVEPALQLIRAYEEQAQSRRSPAGAGRHIGAVCEECGAVSSFPIGLNGTTQQCSACRAYIDVDEPESASDAIVRIPEASGRRVSGWWKCYFFLVAFQAICAVATAYFTSAFAGLDVVYWIFMFLGVVGLYGYVFNADIARPFLWRVFLPLFVAWDMWTFFVQPSITWDDLDPVYYRQSLVIVALFIPQYVAIYRYGRRDAVA